MSRLTTSIGAVALLLAANVASATLAKYTQVRSVLSPDDVVLRNPITDIAGCCARRAIGHASVAPPASAMNSRRLM
jgi:hypothetical protein